MNAYQIIKDFETRVADYTGAPYAVAVDSCTNALFLCCKYLGVKKVTIPLHTYLSVPMSVIHAGGQVEFRNMKWEGVYPLAPYPIFDAAKRFTKNMYIDFSYMCLSFHVKKHLPIGKGGMILTDNKEAVEWFKQARYEGRSEKLYHQDDIQMLGWNMYMTPEQAARGLTLMMNINDINQDLPENDGYRPLNDFPVFKDIPVI